MAGFIFRFFALAALLALAPTGAFAQQDTAVEAAVEADTQSAQAESGSQASSPVSSNRGPRIYPQLAASLVERGVAVIDVRSAEEVEESGMIGDAVNIPHTDLDAITGFIGEDADRAVVMYCGSGRRVSLAIEQLRELGYHGMVNAGGYEDLQQALEAQNEQE